MALGVVLSWANAHDSTKLTATPDASPPIRSGRRGRPRRRPEKLHADKAYDLRRSRRECWARGIGRMRLDAAVRRFAKLRPMLHPARPRSGLSLKDQLFSFIPDADLEVMRLSIGRRGS